MKFETLLTRYKNLGYEPKNVEEEMEIDSIINWVYKKYDIYLYLMHHSLNHQKAYSKVTGIKIKTFSGCKIWNANKEYTNTMFSTKYFDEPHEAKFDIVRDVYKSIKFLHH